ncbi:MAG TPA: sigma-54 dependent transcriptional regulator [Kofleriaceae bacterium]|nr:sigma-54 dependent transcriptional regulator [Kofleriaceae bacterium]
MTTDQRPPATVLIVDDEKNIRRTLRMVLDGEGLTTREASSVAEADAVLASETIDTILLDVKLGDDSGLDLLAKIKADRPPETQTRDPDIPVVVISGHATIDDAVSATRLGAFDFLEKPLDRSRVVVTVRNAIDKRHMLRQMFALKSAASSRYELLGDSAVMVALRRHIAKVAPTRTRVLITGESGTGKELIARAIHRNSLVAGGPFVKVNCAAIPPELIESELFGHEKGAFTGAVAKKRGLFEVADGGTIFLDEIGDMALTAQAKVLRVLQTGEMSRVGGERVVTTQCRTVAATNKNLEAAVKDGTFREDLFFRLNVVPIQSPPLRDRPGDIPLLAAAFARELCEENGFSEKPIAPEVMDKLAAFEWPGNVRELRNVVERMVIMSEDRITLRDVPDPLGGPMRVRRFSGDGLVDCERLAGKSLKQAREEVEAEIIRFQLARLGWNISRTAQALGIERTNLHKKMRTLGINRDE